MVTSSEFELEYEIESVGPSGIGKVELWGTRDGGRTWSDYAVDTDKQSPMPVAVDSEGIYGFRILVQSGTGFGGRPPVEGDLPDVWIGVDLTKPSCHDHGHRSFADRHRAGHPLGSGGRRHRSAASHPAVQRELERSLDADCFRAGKHRQLPVELDSRIPPRGLFAA